MAVSRTLFLFAVVVGLGVVRAAPPPQGPQGSGTVVRAPASPVVITTWDYQQAVARAWKVLDEEGRSALDAVEEGCSLCEAMQCRGTVGYGGSPDEAGETTLDAMIMDGVTMDVGAVAALRRVRGAISVARRVMERTSHTLLAGSQATKFAIQMGFPEQSLTTGHSQSMWQQWLLGNCQPNFWKEGVLPNPRSHCGPYRPVDKFKILSELPVPEPQPLTPAPPPKSEAEVSRTKTESAVPPLTEASTPESASEVMAEAVSTEAIAKAVPTEVMAEAVPTEAIAEAVSTEVMAEAVPTEAAPEKMAEAVPTEVMAEAVPTEGKPKLVEEIVPTEETPLLKTEADGATPETSTINAVFDAKPTEAAAEATTVVARVNEAETTVSEVKPSSAGAEATTATQGAVEMTTIVSETTPVAAATPKSDIEAYEVTAFGAEAKSEEVTTAIPEAKADDITVAVEVTTATPEATTTEAESSNETRKKRSPGPRAVVDPWNHDTIGMVAMDSEGRLAAGTSTNGARHKIAGRVGDSPIPGSGAFADQEVGAAAATGDGDIMMRFVPSFLAVELMRNGALPEAAATEAIRRIAARYPDFSGALIVLRKDGEYGAACHNLPVRSFPNGFPLTLRTASESTVTIKYYPCTGRRVHAKQFLDGDW